jgi:hypothetical protein
MAQEVADIRYAAPLDFRPCRLEFVGNATTCFRDDFDRPLNDEFQLPIAFEICKRLSFYFTTNAINCFNKVTNSMGRLYVPSKHAHGGLFDIFAQHWLQTVARRHIDVHTQRILEKQLDTGEVNQ